MSATYTQRQREVTIGVMNAPRRRGRKKHSRKAVSFENVQQYHEKIPLYSNIASGAQTFDGGKRSNLPKKADHDMRKEMGIIHSGDPVHAKNPKHRNISGQYFVRFATENPNYPSRARKQQQQPMTAPYMMSGIPTMNPRQPAYPYPVNSAVTAYPQQYYGASYQHQMQSVNAMNGMNPMNPYGAVNADMNVAVNGVAAVNMNAMNGMAHPPQYFNQMQPASVPGSVSVNGYGVNIHPGTGYGVGVQPQPPLAMQMPMAQIPPNQVGPTPPVALSTPSSSSTHTVPQSVSGLNLNVNHGHQPPRSVVEAAQSSPKPMMVCIPRSNSKHPKPVGAGKQQFGLCPMFGSAKGCKWGADCFYKHTDPNSVRFCPDFSSPEGCYFGQNCFNRHQTFVFVKSGEQIPRFIRKDSVERKTQEVALREQ